MEAVHLASLISPSAVYVDCDRSQLVAATTPFECRLAVTPTLSITNTLPVTMQALLSNGPSSFVEKLLGTTPQLVGSWQLRGQAEQAAILTSEAASPPSGNQPGVPSPDHQAPHATARSLRPEDRAQLLGSTRFQQRDQQQA